MLCRVACELTTRSIEKRNADDINWKRVAEDVYGLSPEEWKTLLDWKTVNYGGSSSTAAPAPATASVAAAAYTPQTTQDKPSTTSTSAPAATTSKSSGGIDATDLLSGLKLFDSLGVKAGLNSKSAGGNLWLGSDGKYKATFVNDANKDVAVMCWDAKTMWVNANAPQIYVHLGAGQQTTVSIPEGFSGGCGAAFEDSTLFYGLLNESILEFTANPKEKGCFDISREINMNGIVLSAKGSQCTSGVKNGKVACTFLCHSGTTCKDAGSYFIEVGAEQKGPCMVGEYAGAASGGCQMGDGEHMEVTIYGNRAWPS